MHYYLTLFSLFIVLFGGSTSAHAVVELNEFSSEQIKARYLALNEELRCPKCQNQNLAGSDSEVANDLRREILFLLEDGYSDQQIRDFMQERYGDFILYNPPLAGKTLLVWVLPVLFFLCGMVVAIFIIRNAIRNAALSADTDIDSDAGDTIAGDSFAGDSLAPEQPISSEKTESPS